MEPTTPSSSAKQTYELPESRRPGESAVYSSTLWPIMDAPPTQLKTVFDMFAQGLEISKNRPCLGHRPLKANGQRGEYVWQTYDEVAKRITYFGSGLVQLLQQISPGGQASHLPVGVWAQNRPEWTITDLACSAYGLYTVALYDTLGCDTVEYVINHAELAVVVCSAEHVIDLLKIRHKLPNLQVIISMDGLEKYYPVDEWAQNVNIQLFDFSRIEMHGEANPSPYQLPEPEDLAFIMYTSGTTAAPKGAMITHRNFVTALTAAYICVDRNKHDIAISYLPLAHIYGRLNDMLCLFTGSQLGYFSGNVETLADDLQQLKPTLFPTVPRLLNRLYIKITQATVNAPGLTGVVARRAVAAKLQRLADGQGCDHPVWDRLIFNKVKQALGGRVRSITTGSAPVAPEVLQFLRVALCCDIREGYGATETTATTTVHRAKENTAGHVGTPFPCNTIKLVDVPEMNYLTSDAKPRGEVLVRGPNIFKGYYKDPEQTREALDEEGWYRTGDIGMIDEQGRLVIIDRKKHIFKLAQGEYIAPEKIENVYTRDPLIMQIFIHGDGLQASLVAIVVPDPEQLQNMARKLLSKNEHHLPFDQLCQHPDIINGVQRKLVALGRADQLKGFEIPRAVYLESSPFSVDNGLLTPTFKVKRPVARTRYQDHIAAMYRDLEKTPPPAFSSKL
ncbi:uncharacterized protein BYT42DRAFT_576678 [Radiomyces spectabilis]|uniref:uncharacterized protein n=1 Tax=Radiomyces spectabilis TaxID=64574 RepID=UPI00221EA1E2|nr:uncharacterized protein BYT42DRAFT_576678 [Radiomyces spectabilis]KAI8374527.1 hypothetical protein BYT42DRAFT_576678 [Radiomyces spectabilis]